MSQHDQAPGAVVTIDYASGPRRSRRWGRRVLAAVAVLALSLVVYRYGRGWWDGALVRYAVWQASTYNVPPDTVVYEEDAAAADTLLAGGGYKLGPSPGPRGSAATRKDPQELARLRSVLLRPSMMVSIDGPHWGGHPMLFVGERRTPGGKRRIVALRGQFGNGAGTANAPKVRAGFAWVLVEPRARDRPDIKEAGGASGMLSVPLKHSPAGPWDWQRPEARWFAGQTDPDNPSVFYIPYEINGVRGRLTVRLVDEHPDLRRFQNSPRRPRGPLLVIEGVE